MMYIHRWCSLEMCSANIDSALFFIVFFPHVRLILNHFPSRNDLKVKTLVLFNDLLCSQMTSPPSPKKISDSDSTLVSSIFEVIIHSRTLVFSHTLLLAVHLHHLPTTCRLIRLLVISNLDEPRESQTYPLLTAGVQPFLHTRLVARAERQVRGAHLPDVPGLEPDVWLVLAARRVRIEGLRPVDDNLAELLVQFFEDSL